MMLVKDTARRPTLEQIMKHRWMTTDGPHVRQQANLDTPPAILPTLVSLSEMEAAVVSRDADIAYVPTRLRSRHFRDGEFLVRRGDPGSRVMYFIVSGVVNVLLDAAAVSCRRSNIPNCDPHLSLANPKASIPNNASPPSPHTKPPFLPRSTAPAGLGGRHATSVGLNHARGSFNTFSAS